MNPLNQTEEKREAVPNGVSRVGIAALGVLLQVLWIVWAALRLTRYYAWVQLAISVLAFLLALRIYGRHTNSATKLSWIIVILTFPIFGVCLYLLFGRSGAVNIMRGRFTRTDTELQPHYATPLDRAAMPQDPALQNQIHYLQTQAHYPACRNTDVTYYGDTNAALEAQKTDLRKAQHFIFMEYHAIEDSIAWQGIEDILAERAAAGVEVRVFYDDMGSIGFVDTAFAKKLQQRGIQCRVFNPIVPVLNVFMNNRDHRKITVIDGQVGYTGGYNLADEYFNLTHPYGRWKDSGVRLEGDAVRNLTLIFGDGGYDTERNAGHRALSACHPLHRPGGCHCAALRRQPAGRQAGGRGCLPQLYQQRPAVCIHHHALPDLERRDAAGAGAGGPAGRGCADHHAGHPG